MKYGVKYVFQSISFDSLVSCVNQFFLSTENQLAELGISIQFKKIIILKKSRI